MKPAIEDMRLDAEHALSLISCSNVSKQMVKPMQQTQKLISPIDHSLAIQKTHSEAARWTHANTSILWWRTSAVLNEIMRNVKKIRLYYKNSKCCLVFAEMFLSVIILNGYCHCTSSHRGI